MTILTMLVVNNLKDVNKYCIENNITSLVFSTESEPYYLFANTNCSVKVIERNDSYIWPSEVITAIYDEDTLIIEDSCCRTKSVLDNFNSIRRAFSFVENATSEKDINVIYVCDDSIACDKEGNVYTDLSRNADYVVILKDDVFEITKSRY